MDFDPVPFSGLPAILNWLLIAAIVGGMGLVIALFGSLIAQGVRGLRAVFEGLWDGVQDLAHSSPRRVWALTMLTIRESWRRKTFLVMVVFGVLFLFAGWFLSGPGTNPDFQLKVYVSFVLTAMSWMILPAVLLLSCWGLPEDIKARSLHTVVTKPVRRNEVLLGRVLGIILVGTGVIILMSVVGYIWLSRALLGNVPPEKLLARRPTYGNISFMLREGRPATEGINTGDIWEFRSYIEGNTRALAIWEFEGVTPERFGDNLTLETNIQVFRTHKGDLDAGVLCQYVFVNPERRIRAAYKAFPIVEFHPVNVQTIARDSLLDEQNKPVDIYNDIVRDGKLRVEVRCLTSGQFLGMARPDLFIRARDGSFVGSFFKSVVGVWEMMVLLVVVGVTASCFLKGPIATLLTFVLVMLAQVEVATGFLEQLTGDKWLGGGPLESIYRIITGMNQTVPLPKTALTTAFQTVDHGALDTLWAVRHIIPNFNYYNLAPYTANGYDVPWDAALLPGLMVTLGYVIPCLALGYFSLKARELESK